MKNNRNLAIWRRGLALLLAVCLAAGYVPVPGHADGCTHEHGEGCYEVTTECVHTHDESCYTDPALMEAGEEADACGHECTEESGCVVRALNCGHVHDAGCGEGVEEPEEEPKEEPEPQPEEPEGEKTEEGPKEEPKEELQPQEEPQPEEAGEVAVYEGNVGQTDEARIGDTGYATLEAAIAAAQKDETVTLLTDLVLTDSVRINKSMTLDLNGKTLEGADGSPVITVAGNFTLTDTSEGQTGKVTHNFETTQKTGCGVKVEQGCTVYLHGGSICGNSNTVGGGVYGDLLSSLIVTGGSISNNFAEYSGGCSVEHFIMVGGTIQGNVASAENGGVFAARLALLGGSIIGNHAGEECGGVRRGQEVFLFEEYENYTATEPLTITGNTATDNRTPSNLMLGGLPAGTDGRINPASRIGIIQTSGYAVVTNITEDLLPCFLADTSPCKGFYAAQKTLVFYDAHDYTGSTTGQCTHCGYVCTHANASLDTGVCPICAKQVYQAKIGTTGYATLDAALTEAQKTENCTVTLLCDVLGEYTITGGNFTLDLNGRTISSSGKTIRLYGGALTLTDSGTSGRVTGNVAVDMSDGELNIRGGTYSGGTYGLYIRTYSTSFVSISGGMFERIGVAAPVDGNLVDCLAPNHAFYADPDGKTIVNAAVKGLSGTVYVREHTSHTFNADGACPCGYQCPHTEAVADLTTGKCACGKVQIYEAKIGDTGYGSLGGAMDAAEERPGCTVTLLCDVSNEESGRADTLVVRSGGYTLDLNGHKVERTIGENLTIWVSGSLVIVDTAGGGQITNTCGNSAIDIPEGSLTIQGGTISGDVTAEKAATLTISGGAFMGKLRHTRHNLVEDLAEGCAFYADPEGRTIVSGAAEELTGPVYVLGNHSHNYVNGKCDCGRCSHISVDMDTGKCAQCGYQMYLAKVGVNHQGYATLREAFSAAAQTPNSTVTLLADVNVLEEDTNYCYVLDRGTFTLDLNGRKIINDEDTNYGMEIFRIQGANLTIEGDAPGSEIRRAEWGVSAIALNSGSLTIRGGKIAGRTENISTAGGELTISGGTFDRSLYISAKTTAAISGGSFSRIATDHDSLLDVLAPGYAFFDADSGKILDASGTSLKIVCVREHTHAKRDGYETCACGYTFPPATVTQAPAPLALTYTGQPQDLVTPGTADGGTMVYSLTEKGTYTAAIPTGALPKTYTVYYKVQGDDSHLDTEPQKVSVTVAPTDLYLDLTDTGLTGTVTVGGKDYPIEETDGKRFVTLPEEGDLFTAYTYGGDSAHPYPTGMNVYAIERKTTGSTATELTDLRNLLTYAGCSIRISGKQGIRMITSLDEATKKALTGKGFAGYTLEEYGTVVSWTDVLGNGNFLRLDESYARSNYAYLKGKADPVFARKNGIIQYTNVLLLENLTADDYDKDLTLRAYIKLRDTATGETVTLYGGTVTRSIYYVATQNADTYKPGTTGYKFVRKIIDAVENP